MITPDIPYTQELMRLDEPNRNGMIYPREVMEAAIKAYGKKLPVFITRSPSTGRGVNIEDTIGFIDDIRVEENRLVGEVKFSSTLLNGIDPNDFNVSLNGMGKIGEGGRISDFEIMGYNIYPKEQEIVRGKQSTADAEGGIPSYQPKNV